MRVIAGTLGGRIFASPKTQRTHPMSEKIRGAMFNSLGSLNDLTILDAFSGSGALAFEAVSRGAKHVIAVESDPIAQKSIKNALTLLNIPNYQLHLVNSKIQAWLQTTEINFNIVLCDPPYNKIDVNLLKNIAKRVQNKGIAVFSLPPNIIFTLSQEYNLLSVKDYGDAKLYFYQRK